MKKSIKYPSGGNPQSGTFSRRSFVKRVFATTAAANMVALPIAATQASVRPSRPKLLKGAGVGSAQKRRADAFQIRHNAALNQKLQGIVTHLDNGDEGRYPNKIASFSKGLPHNHLGEVDVAAYGQLLAALSSGDPDAFERIPMGCPDLSQRRRLVNPQAGLAFDVEGADSYALAIPPAPAFESAEEAGEMVEDYWMALARDIPFSEYDAHPLTNEAANDLSRLSDFRGPKSSGRVTTRTLFRGLTPGDVVGPYISQFLWQPTPFGANYVEQRMRTKMPGSDHMTGYDEWLAVQQGFLPTQAEVFDTVRRYIRNGRDLSQWVHIDVLYQAYFHAMLILLALPSDDDAQSSGIGAPFNIGNPYHLSETQEGFGTFGGPHVASLLCEVATRALKAVWFQKWYVHRRLRPEAFGGRVHNHLTGRARYPIESEDLMGSEALRHVYDRYGTYLLPMAFPEGSPVHPAYGAGHATVAGACTTILKAYFDESYVIPNPIEVTADGLGHTAHSGPPLTVGGELNKLASNVALGRDHAGVHWRSDATYSLQLGEAIAISILRDQKETYNESFGGFTFTKFDGTSVTV